MKNKSLRIYILLLSVGAFLSSCSGPNDTGWEYAPNMYNSIGYESQSQIEKNAINPLGLNMREPVKGTISRRNYKTSFVQDDSSVVNDLMIYNIDQNGLQVAEATLKNPIPWSESVEDQGKVLYEKNCQHCHGAGGAGDGKVGAVYKGVPNYASDAYKNMNDGHIFHVITFGKGRMWPHGAQVTPEERWKIVHYVHRLQLGS
ncbi:c-type cytochrome [Lacihabitans lacunae]|jgi:cytochrome c5|uniref:C-type cytochrome n=1 Tax=Lacihabitans lacunae TaxID=1028214 RepID=A0ABV7YZN4_9BACT